MDKHEMDIHKNEFIWENKYRPKTVSECVLPKLLKKKALGVVETGQMQNMIFYSGPGTGKTTLAQALCNDMGVEYIMINGSKEGRLIETVRNIVTKFTSSMSIYGNDKIKVVIYDEFDNSGDVQMAIRGLVQEVSANCRFIFTGNYINKIIPAIQSRCSLVDFSITPKEKPLIMTEIMTRCQKILDNEGITYNNRVLAVFISKMFPDFRKILNELQAYSVTGKIDEGIIDMVSTRYDDLIVALTKKNYKDCKKWMDNNHFDGSIYSNLLDGLEKKMGDKTEFLEMILEADHHQYRHSFAIDPTITLGAFCVKVMGLL